MSAREPEVEYTGTSHPVETFPAATPMEFVETREEVEGTVMHIGFHNAQLVLVAASGEWIRYVLPSVDDAKEACDRLGIECHDGFPDHLRRRMGSYVRSPEDWEDAPYPERYRSSST